MVEIVKPTVLVRTALLIPKSAKSKTEGHLFRVYENPSATFQTISAMLSTPMLQHPTATWIESTVFIVVVT